MGAALENLPKDKEVSKRHVFVVGCPRSGTTLLTTILGRHSELTSTPETHFFSLLSKFEKEHPHGSCQKLKESFIDSRGFRDLNLDRAIYETRLSEQALSPKTIINTALGLAAENRAKHGVVEKTPGHALHIEKILEFYPDAKIICIVRDLRGCLNSVNKAQFDWDPLHFIHWWHRIASAIERANERFAKNVTIVRYEDLLSDTPLEIKKISRFLDLPFESSMLNTSEGENPCVPKWESEWKDKANKIVDLDRAESWRRELSPFWQNFCKFMLSEWLEKFSYPAPVAYPIRVASRSVLPHSLLLLHRLHRGLKYIVRRCSSNR